MSRQVILAKTAGFCFGVDRAVNLVYELVEKGVVAKTKSKAKGGRMVYMSIEVLEKQGYEREKLVC